jgi:hypothetical protein
VRGASTSTRKRCRRPASRANPAGTRSSEVIVIGLVIRCMICAHRPCMQHEVMYQYGGLLQVYASVFCPSPGASTGDLPADAQPGRGAGPSARTAPQGSVRVRDPVHYGSSCCRVTPPHRFCMGIWKKVDRSYIGASCLPSHKSETGVRRRESGRISYLKLAPLAAATRLIAIDATKPTRAAPLPPKKVSDSAIASALTDADAHGQEKKKMMIVTTTTTTTMTKDPKNDITPRRAGLHASREQLGREFVPRSGKPGQRRATPAQERGLPPEALQQLLWPQVTD